MDDFRVAVSAGSLRGGTGTHLPHRWTPEGVDVETESTGAHLLHVAVAACVLNDLYREGGLLGIEVAGARVSVAGGFDGATWRSTGVTYVVELDSPASPSEQDALVATVDAVAEIPRALRHGAQVRRTGG